MATTDDLEFAQLSWMLIEWKVAYYMPEAVHPQRRKDYEVSDEVYDAAELRYLNLIRIIGKQRETDPLFASCDFKGPRNSVVHKAWPGFEDLVEPPHFPMVEVDPSRPSVQLVLAKLGSPKPRKRTPRKRR